MAEVRISTLENAPPEGTGIRIDLVHPLTEFEYQLALFHVEGKFYVLTDKCKNCNGNLSAGTLNGMYIACPMQGHPWHIKTGLLKYDRSRSLPSYRVAIKEDGLYIEI